MVEIWKDINGYEGLYQVSNLGRVKSLERTIIRKGGKPLKINEKIRKLGIDKDGYKKIDLYVNTKDKMFMVHRLVAEAFIPNPDNKPQVNHINGKKDDNLLENLEWCTNTENQIHAYKTGLKNSLKGINHPNVKLNNIQIDEIRKSNETLITLSKKYGVAFQTISKIKNNKLWVMR